MKFGARVFGNDAPVHDVVDVSFRYGGWLWCYAYIQCIVLRGVEALLLLVRGIGCDGDCSAGRVGPCCFLVGATRIILFGNMYRCEDRCIIHVCKGYSLVQVEGFFDFR